MLPTIHYDAQDCCMSIKGSLLHIMSVNDFITLAASTAEGIKQQSNVRLTVHLFHGRSSDIQTDLQQLTLYTLAFCLVFFYLVIFGLVLDHSFDYVASPWTLVLASIALTLQTHCYNGRLTSDLRMSTDSKRVGRRQSHQLGIIEVDDLSVGFHHLHLHGPQIIISSTLDHLQLYHS